METIQSRYLRRDFEFEPATMQRNDGPVTIIPHNVLWDIIHNQIPGEQGVTYDYMPISITREHCFIQCTLRDAKGRVVHEFGESVSETLTSAIAKNIPGTMASIRAFDRAAIKYLDFDCDGKVYSDTEIPEAEIQKTEAGAKTQTPRKPKSAKAPETALPPEPQEDSAPSAAVPPEPQDDLPSALVEPAEAAEASETSQEASAATENDAFGAAIPGTWQNGDIKQSVLDAMSQYSEVIIFDTETSGLKAAEDRILELSARKFSVREGSLTPIDELHTYIKPPFSIDPKITELNGITNEFLNDKPVEEDAFVDIFNFFGEQPQILCAYNTPFDVRFLQALYKRQEKSLTPVCQLDVLAMARDIVKTVSNYKLETVADACGLAGEEFHTAAFDTEVTVKLFERFYAEYDKSPGGNTEAENAADSEKIRPGIQSITPFNKSSALRRIYVNTDYGTVYYDSVKHQWASKDAKLETLDMNYLEKEAWKLTGAGDQKSFEGFNGKWPAAA